MAADPDRVTAAEDAGRSLLAEEIGRYPSLAAAMADGVGVFCAMGVCQQCDRSVAGTVVRSCLVRSGHA